MTTPTNGVFTRQVDSCGAVHTVRRFQTSDVAERLVALFLSVRGERMGRSEATRRACLAMIERLEEEARTPRPSPASDAPTSE